MEQRYVIKASACLEIAVGAIFVAAPDLPCMLLFATTPESMGRPLARWIGVSLLALGIAFLPPKGIEPHRRTGWGLFVFNAGLASVLAYYGATTSVHGIFLWPGVILHALIAALLLPPLFSPRGWWYVASVIDETITKQPK